MSIVILGIDLGKNLCSVVGIVAAGAIVVRRSMRRRTLIDYMAKLETCKNRLFLCSAALRDDAAAIGVLRGRHSGHFRWL